ncbi:hypothetical protein [Reinekea sp.]|jgi:hypothetical protein|uniref:hypothetical protein n=1 Tax=Reinekea sp. TaxID=1970455 RepID=UPI002A831332|nr:hypothetical protein [Reinekea sp.]
MKKIPIITALACGILISACNPSSSSSAVDNSGSDSSDSSDTSSDDTTRLLISGNLALPEQMALVSASDTTDDATRALTSTRELISSAAMDEIADDSDYKTQRQNIYVYLDASEPIDFIDNFLCYTGQVQTLAMKGQGNYTAWVDAGCFEERDGSGQEQGTKDPAPAYITTIANATMAEAENSPLVINSWVPEFPTQGTKVAIKMLGEVKETPTETNPYGIFSLTYGLLPTMDSPKANTLGYGEVISSRTEDGSSSFTLYQYDADRDDQGNPLKCTTVASVNYDETTQVGRARTATECLDASEVVDRDRSRAFALSVNADLVHMATADTLDELGRDDVGVCLNRNTVKETAWGYGLYDLDGSEIVVNSGVQLHIDADGDGQGTDTNGFESWGQMGYGGSWRQDGEAWTDGEMVQESTRGDSEGETYTVKVAPGKLIKNTIKSVLLSDLRDVVFEASLYESDLYTLSGVTDFNNDGDEDDFLTVLLQANDTNNGFKVVGIQTGWDESGPVIVATATPFALPLKTDVSLRLWSNQLGGDANYKSTSTTLPLTTRTFVNGSEVGTNELFSGVSVADLVCIERCLKADVGSAEIGSSADYAAVFVGDDARSTTSYDFAKAELTLVDDAGSNPVGLDTGLTQTDLDDSPHWSWGLQTGPMITRAVASEFGITDADTYYTALDGGIIKTFYVWETGLKPWQQQTVLVDNTNTIVGFDRPIGIQYTHSTANDRNDDDAKDGAVFILEYGGKGQLNGLPWQNTNNHWGPVINLADGVIVADRDRDGIDYMFKALDVEQSMTTALDADCAAMPFDAPSERIPTDITQRVFDLEGTPEITDATPSVISGVVQVQ